MKLHPEGQIESYRFLQAKHKQNEKSEKITAAELLNDNNGEFSLPNISVHIFVILLKDLKDVLSRMCTIASYAPTLASTPMLMNIQKVGLS